MPMPTDLRERGQRAYRAAAEQVDAELYDDCVRRYARAIDLADMIRADWISRGAPLLYESPSGALRVHPLVTLLREAEADAAVAARAVFLDPSRCPSGRAPGRPRGAVSAVDRRPAPPVLRLASVSSRADTL